MDREHIRNFSIIAHIDHGKSTLADRLLELTHTIEARSMRSQYLDQMDLERERGITIKMQPVRMVYQAPTDADFTPTDADFMGTGAIVRDYANDDFPRESASSLRRSAYILNLIDTPGHVDFSYEVSRSLAAVEGAILLVDGTKGIQAQTLAHLHQAQKQNLVIIPAINKIDLTNARPDEIEVELIKLLGPVDALRVSAKDGTNVDKVIGAVIEKMPPPRSSQIDCGSRALVFDSSYDAYKGVIAFVRVFDGVFKSQQKIRFLAPGKEAEILEVGYFKPQLQSQSELSAGEIGYIATGLKDPSLVRVGDTILSNYPASAEASAGRQLPTTNYQLLALPGYQEPAPVVFASLFPKDGAEFTVLKDALSKLKLSDAALSFELDSQEILGRGFRCGFLGSLHMEIVLERLKREYNLSLITTTPSVSYQIEYKDGRVQTIFSAADLPSADRFKEVREPWVRLNILTPSKYLGGVMELASQRRGVYKNTEYLSAERAELVYEIPLSEIIVDFHDKLKSVSSGYASLSYEFLEMRRGDLVKLDILLAGELVSALARIVPRDQAPEEGRRIVTKLKELLPREWFKVSLQAAIGGKIIAREDIAALKKDVTGYLYGGDITRKMKLREKQKRGKKKMKALGRVDIPSEVFFELLKR